MKTRLLSLVLVFALILQIVPAAVFATEDDNDTRSLDELMLTDEASLVPAEAVCDEILFEDTSLREENVKHFRMKDGSYRVVVYDTPVHYLDDEGNWQEYDNTLHTIDRSGEATSYRVENGDSVRLFAAEADSEALLSVSKGEYALTISPVLTPDAERPVEPEPPVEVMGGVEENTGADAEDEVASAAAEQATDTAASEALSETPTESEQESIAASTTTTTEAGNVPETQQPKITGAGITVDPKDEPLVSAEVLTIAAPAEEEITDTFFAQAQPEKLYSALEYENLLDGATLRYENYANSVKESIIIPARQDDYTYSFRLQVTGLTPELLDNGSISLTNADGKTIYTIPAPYMMDAKNETLYDAFYKLEESNGGWLLTVTADAAWMNDKDRTYPVLLDPTVTETAGSSDDICASFVSSGYPDGTAGTDTGLYVGNNGNDNKIIRSYFHINNLPKLPAGCEITKADFGLYQYAYQGSGSMDINLHALSSAKKDGNPINGYNTSITLWKNWASALTWNRVNNGYSATHDPLVIDRKTTGSATTGTYVAWDITTLAAKWYDSDNDNNGHYEANIGFALIAANESAVGPRTTFYGPQKTSNRPRITIEYSNMFGVEPDYTYQTASVGNAGTAYIGDFTMQTALVVPLVSDPSDVMPFSVSLAYNSNMTGRYYSGTFDDIHTKNFDNMKIGIGWKLSLQETVVSKTIDGKTYLIHADGDGTEHYYIYSGGVYVEETSNSRTTITGSGAQYTLSDEYGNKKLFTNGYLTEVQDAYGNALYYCYDGYSYSSGSSLWKPSSTNAHRITSVYRKNVGCNAVQILTLDYENNFLYKLTTASNRVITLTQTAADATYTNLTAVNFPGGVTAQYTYYSPNAKFWRMTKLATAYDAEAKYGIEFDYSYNGKTNTIFEYVYEGSTKLYGTKMHGYKRSHLLAVYRDYGRNQTPNNSDDYLTFKVLNRTGRLICGYTTDADETRVLGSSAASYTSNSNRKANNLLAANAYTGQPGVNLLRNGDAENVGSYWSAITTSTAAHWSGSYAFVLNSQYPSFYQLADLAGKEAYTFSGYVRLDNAIADGGVYLALLDANTGTELARSQSVNVVTGGINNGWQRLTVTYAPSTRVVVKASVISTGLGSNVAYADCLQLEREDAASTYNLIETGSFDQLSSVPVVGSSNNIFGWYYAGNIAFEGGARFGSKMAKIYGRSGAQRVSQNITVNAPAGSTFLLSGWGKANALPDSVAQKSSDDQPYFGLVARIYYADGSSEPFYFSFDPYFSDWQERSGILMPSEANQNKAITSVTVVAAYDNNANTAYFDNISLRLEPSQTYRYDSNGNPVAATQPGTGSESASYSNSVDLTGYTAANGSKYTYTYNSAHDITSAKVGGLTATTTYNVNGNATGAKLTADGTNLYMETSSTPTPDRNHTETVTDANGYTTTYAYYSNGQLLSVTDAKEQTTNYTYNDALRTKSTYREGIANIDYSYTDGRLTSLDRKTFRDSAAQHQYYYFAYNAWGQPTTTKVGSRTLSTNTYYDYAGKNTGTGGNLKQTTYGNNDSISYSYDNLDRLIRKTYNDTNEYTEYSYNAEGAIGELRHCSIQNGQSTLTTYRFEYDSLGRLVRSSEAEGDTVKLRTEHIYDGYNRLSKQKWSGGGKTYTEYYTYDDGASGDGSLKQFRTTSGQKINLTYDKLKRLQKASITSNGGVEYYTVGQSYYTSGSKTTPRVEYYNYRMTGGALVAGDRYVYDELGNITEIQESEIAAGGSTRRPKVKYTYDKQNQLKTETRYTYSSNTDTTGSPVTYSYSYDTAGNILSVTSNSATLTYTYGDSNWRDLLTAVGGTTISYDGSGNPTNWYNGSNSYSNLTWKNGRQLTQLTTGGKTTSYTYDADGIRTSKDVNGTKHEYLTLNGKVVWEKIGEGTSAKIMVFSYDAQGRPFAVKFSKNNGVKFTNYFYALNQQGDVVKIFRPVAVTDANGNTTGYTEKTYATYTYDAWGKLIGITNSTGTSIINKQTTSNSLANLNPLRYRGYYYDNETGFYYLQSRYYDPAVRRFINADVYASTDSADAVSCNMFAYCGNNPVMRSDETGDFWNFVIGAVVGAVVNAVTTAVSAVKEGGWEALSEGKTWAKIGVSAATGAINGAVAASGLGIFAQAGISAVTSAVGDIANQWIDTGSLKKVNYARTLHNGLVAGGVSVVGSITGGLLSSTKMSQGNELVSAGLDKYLKGSARELVGKSSSNLLKHGAKLVFEGNQLINTARGITSVSGTLLTWGVSNKYTIS